MMKLIILITFLLFGAVWAGEDDDSAECIHEFETEEACPSTGACSAGCSEIEACGSSCKAVAGVSTCICHFDTAAKVNKLIEQQVSEIASASGGPACFSGESLATTPMGTKAVKNLQPGDMVLAMGPYNETVFSPVMFQVHAANQDKDRMVVLRTKSGRTLKLTKDHLMFIACDCGIMDFNRACNKPAGKVVVGDCLYAVGKNQVFPSHEHDRVDAIEYEIVQGLYAPITEAGTIIVDGITASCYAHAVNHHPMHAVFTVFRSFPRSAWPALQAFFHQIDEPTLKEWMFRMYLEGTYSKEKGVCYGGTEPNKNDDKTHFFEF